MMMMIMNLRDTSCLLFSACEMSNYPRFRLANSKTIRQNLFTLFWLLSEAKDSTTQWLKILRKAHQRLKIFLQNSNYACLYGHFDIVKNETFLKIDF